MGAAGRDRARRTCIDCGRPARHGACEPCKREKRRLRALHLEHADAGCEADREGRALRVALYAAVVGAGGKLFEGGRRP